MGGAKAPPVYNNRSKANIHKIFEFPLTLRDLLGFSGKQT